jgi:hypothetical protein
MPSGASPEREREYEELRDEFIEEGRYPGRADEVAARIVNKQRGEFGETQAARQEEQHGESPDRDLPVPGYQHLTVAELTRRLKELGLGAIERLRDFERSHRNRKTLMAQYNRALLRDSGRKLKGRV